MCWIQHTDLIGFTVVGVFIGLQRRGSFRGLHMGTLMIGWRDEDGNWRFRISWA